MTLHENLFVAGQAVKFVTALAGGIVLGAALPKGKGSAEADSEQPAWHMTPTVPQSGAGFGVVGAW